MLSVRRSFASNHNLLFRITIQWEETKERNGVCLFIARSANMGGGVGVDVGTAEIKPPCSNKSQNSIFEENLSVGSGSSSRKVGGRGVMSNPSAPVVLAFQWNQSGPKAGNRQTYLSTASTTASQTLPEDTAQVLIPVYGP